MAIAAVLKTAVRKDFWVRVPGPPLRTTPTITVGDIASGPTRHASESPCPALSLS
jgi:hypothetical protein